MSKHNLRSGVVELPDFLVEILSTQPQNVDRRAGAELISSNLFPVSPRTLEAWPLPTRHVNGKAIIQTRKLFEVAYAKFMAAPLVMSGRRQQREERGEESGWLDSQGSRGDTQDAVEQSSQCKRQRGAGGCR